MGKKNNLENELIEATEKFLAEHFGEGTEEYKRYLKKFREFRHGKYESFWSLFVAIGDDEDAKKKIERIIGKLERDIGSIEDIDGRMKEVYKRLIDIL
jgi:predicted phage-related endonuclease